MSELVVKAQYICYMQENTNWYWEQHPLQHAITVSTRTILHPCLVVFGIIYVQYIPKSRCNRTQAKKDIHRHPICLKDADYDYILDEI